MAPHPNTQSETLEMWEREMQRMRIVVAGALAALCVLVAAPSGAATQTIDAVLGNAVSMSTSPTSSISGWSLASTGANTTSGGSVGVTANVPYTVTVSADKSRMTEYITASSTYVTGGSTLTSPLAIVPTLTSGAGVPVASLSVGTSAGTLATGTGLTTDVFSLTLSQPTVISDVPLAAGRTYHVVLTYTAAAV